MILAISSAAVSRVAVALKLLSLDVISTMLPFIFRGLTITLYGTPRRSASENITPALMLDEHIGVLRLV